MPPLTRRHILLAGTALAAGAMFSAPAFAVDAAELNAPPALGEMALGADEGLSLIHI